MNWMELREEEFDGVVKLTDRLCIVPLGCVEADGPHLPVGASLRIAEAFAKEAAKLENAVVFPAFEFGDTAGTVERRGSVNLRAKLRTATIEGYCMEISRAGFDKILFVPYPPLHPGLGNFFAHFTRFLNHIPRDFSVFSCATTPSIKDVIYPAILEKGAEYCPELLPEDIEILREYAENPPFDLRGGFTETCLMLALRPDLVAMDRLNGGSGKSTGIANAMLEAGLISADLRAINYPNSYAADDPTKANARIGRFLLRVTAETIANSIRVYKDQNCRMTERRAQRRRYY